MAPRNSPPDRGRRGMPLLGPRNVRRGLRNPLKRLQFPGIMVRRPPEALRPRTARAHRRFPARGGSSPPASAARLGSGASAGDSPRGGRALASIILHARDSALDSRTSGAPGSSIRCSPRRCSAIAPTVPLPHIRTRLAAIGPRTCWMIELEESSVCLKGCDRRPRVPARGNPGEHEQQKSITRQVVARFPARVVHAVCPLLRSRKQHLPATWPRLWSRPANGCRQRSRSEQHPLSFLPGSFRIRGLRVLEPRHRSDRTPQGSPWRDFRTHGRHCEITARWCMILSGDSCRASHRPGGRRAGATIARR
jgi:hypothetical protein